MKKRIFSFFLAVLMAAGLFTVTANKIAEKALSVAAVNIKPRNSVAVAVKFAPKRLFVGADGRPRIFASAEVYIGKKLYFGVAVLIARVYRISEGFKLFKI